MRDWRAVPVPPRMSALPRDRRGYPIPANVFRDKDGRPHFTINDERLRVRFLREDRCPICAQRLTRGRWFVGGPCSALDPHGAYVDLPLHYECAEYALQVCPYLAVSGWTKRIDDQTLSDRTATVLVDQTMSPDQPAVFVAVMAVKQEVIAGGQYVRPKRPYQRIEYWRDGARIEPDEARVLIEGLPPLGELRAAKILVPSAARR